jgi:CelD/BcsL family acetyltransferase involved in cellulose biosynthesis
VGAIVSAPAVLAVLSGEVALAPAPPRARAEPAFEIGLVDSHAGFEALESAWNDLFERAGRAAQVFQRYDWLSHWARIYRDPAVRLALVVAWRDGRLAMVWPLVRARAFGLDVIRWMGEPVSQYGDALVEDGPQSGEMLEAGWRRVRALGADLIALRKVRADARVAGLLAAHCSAAASMAAPYADLSRARTFDAWQERYTPKARSDRRRLRRRLEDVGAVGFVSAPGGEDAVALTAQAFAMKRAWLARRGLGSPALEDPRMEAFFAALVGDPKAGGNIVIDSVTCGGEAVAIAVSIDCGGETFGHILAHNPDFDKKGVGILLADAALRAAHGRGLTRFDMLAPADPYKKDWSDGEVAVHDWTLAISLTGWLYAKVWLDALRPRIKRMLLRMPPNVARGLWAALRGLKIVGRG